MLSVAEADRSQASQGARRQGVAVQVHPRPENAAQLGGEPKTELWYLLDAILDSDLYAGLRRGVTRADFERLQASDAPVIESLRR